MRLRVSQDMLTAHDGGMPMYDFTSLSCAQISEAVAESRASSQVGSVVCAPPAAHSWAAARGRTCVC
jgi:hypothetical protein